MQRKPATAKKKIEIWQIIKFSKAISLYYFQNKILNAAD